MQTKQTIVIVGSGCAGKAIATRLAMGNFQLLLCDKEYEKAVSLARELEGALHPAAVEAMQCTFDGAWEADVVVLALEMDEQMEVAAIIKNVINQKILISTILPGTASEPTSNEMVRQHAILQSLLPNTKIVRINALESLLPEATSPSSRLGVVLSGTDDKVIAIVAGLLESAGLQVERTEMLSTGCEAQNSLHTKGNLPGH